ncbi:MAG: arginine--tRNA ligase, partial [bacterium]|nr:arginine--tRNA ligase [bacterium]
MEVKNEIISSLKKALKDLGIEGVEPELDVPKDDSHGDYSSNAAMAAFSSSRLRPAERDFGGQAKFKTPLELAEEIAKKLNSSLSTLPNIEKVEAVKPGFINFWLSKDYLLEHLREILGKSSSLASQGSTLQGRQGKKIMVEFAHPNTHKSFHIGHLRNISIGESIVRLLEAGGCNIIRANYQGDVGMHIAKAIYALLYIPPFRDDISKVKGIHERVDFLGKTYAAGSKAFEEDETAKKSIKDINYLVYASAQRFQADMGVKPSSTDYMKFVEGRKDEVDKVYKLWKETRQWSLDYFETIYKRVYTHYDRYYFESECLAGAGLAKEAVKKGILEENEGAIIFNGKKYGLDTRVFVNSLGLPTYEGKELALAKVQFTEHGRLDKLIHVLGPEQVSFTKVTFKVEDLLGMQKNQQYHLVYGWVRLKEGKMSSRTGNVVLGDWLLDEAKTRIKKEFTDMDEEAAEKIAVGAVKYSMLKFSTASDISFSFDESISLEGNSGPYIQYTFARTQSVLRKSEILASRRSGRNPKSETILNDQISKSMENGKWKMENEEVLLLRTLHR